MKHLVGRKDKTMSAEHKQLFKQIASAICLRRALASGHDEKYALGILILEKLEDGLNWISDDIIKHALEFNDNIYFVEDQEKWPDWMRSGASLSQD